MPIDRASCRPDFLVLCYPVITMSDPFTHAGSRSNLLGKQPDPKLVENLSNEKQVTERTPPTFLFHTTADTAVPAENSVHVLPGAAQGQGSGGIAHLRARQARRRAGQQGPDSFQLARPAGVVAQRCGGCWKAVENSLVC